MTHDEFFLYVQRVVGVGVVRRNGRGIVLTYHARNEPTRKAIIPIDAARKLGPVVALDAEQPRHSSQADTIGSAI